MEIGQTQIIGELVSKDYRAASVFKKYGIDFCCQGNRTINDACEKKNVAVEQVITDLNNVIQKKTDKAIDYNSWPLDLLADYIEKTHHKYVEQKIGEILPYLTKISKVHGDRHPELFEINELFTASAGELTTHMKKEELVLFPYIRKAVKAADSHDDLTPPHFGTVQNPIQMMMNEHETEGERFRTIAELTEGYNPPEDACNTYRVAFALLKEFEDDLHLHIHLENNILFPNAIKLEQKLNALHAN